MVSDVYGGKASDTYIFAQSGVVELCDEHDAVMVDKDFRVDELSAKKSIQLIRPPFKCVECEVNSAIARARVHVELSLIHI